MEYTAKAFTIFWQIYKNNQQFKKIIDENMKSGKIRFFEDEEWKKIKSQNFTPPLPDVKNFFDMYNQGYNIGNCVNMSMQLSYSYDNVDLVSGILPLLKGTTNAEKEGGHCWLETQYTIIDSSLMLVIDKSLKDMLGYIEETRLTSGMLLSSSFYQARKDFVNDHSLNLAKSDKPKK